MEIKNYNQIIENLNKNDFLEELKNNKGFSKGKLLNLFTSDWRTKDAIINKFKEIAELSGNKNYQWRQNKNENKFKRANKIFAKKMQLFSVDKENVFSLTKKGSLWFGAVKNGNEDIFFKELLQYFDIEEEIRVLRNSFNRILNDENIQSLIKRIQNNPHKDLLKEYTIISIIKIPNFVEYIIKFPEDILKLSSYLDKLGVFSKYKDGKITKSTLIDSLNIINSYKNTTFNGVDSNRYTNVLSKKIKRDNNEVLKVLKRSQGICEICESSKWQFKQKSGKLYSHAHHLMPLGKLENSSLIQKYDKAKYMINLCPFHHASIHNNHNRYIFLKAIKKAKEWGMNEKLIDLEK